MTDENKAIIRRLYQEAVNGGDLSVIDELYAPDVELHLPGIPQDPYGPEGVKRFVGLVRDAFPAVVVTIEALIAEQDKVVASVLFHGVQPAPSQGASPYEPMTGWARIDIYRLFQGRIVEQWADRDDMGTLHQLGIG